MDDSIILFVEHCFDITGADAQREDARRRTHESPYSDMKVSSPEPEKSARDIRVHAQRTLEEEGEKEDSTYFS